MFHAHRQVTRIEVAVFLSHLMFVQMPMNISREPFHLLRMDWHVTQNELVQHVVGANVLEKRRVAVQVENIVIALDQHLAPVQPVQNETVPTIDEHIAEMVHLVVGPNHVVPVLDERVVHLLHIIPRPQLGAIGAAELANVRVTEMS